jgi:hypothetical protein
LELPSYILQENCIPSENTKKLKIIIAALACLTEGLDLVVFLTGTVCKSLINLVGTQRITLFVAGLQFTTVSMTGLQFTTVSMTGLQFTTVSVTGFQFTTVSMTGLQFTTVSMTGLEFRLSVKYQEDIKQQDTVVWNKVFLTLNIPGSCHKFEKSQTNYVVFNINFQFPFVYYQLYWKQSGDRCLHKL